MPITQALKFSYAEDGGKPFASRSVDNSINLISKLCLYRSKELVQTISGMWKIAVAAIAN